MSTSLLKRIKSKVFIPSQRKATHILEGEYHSITLGRGMDFEDLREYAIGDDIKDIDWKASARHSEPLVKRNVAPKRHIVSLVVDTGKNMTALSPSGESKINLALTAAGVMGYLAVRHTDSVTAVFGNSEETSRIPAKATESHLERILQAVSHSNKSEPASSDITTQLEEIRNQSAQRMVIVVIADEFDTSDKTIALLRSLKHRHEIIWISIADADPTAPEFASVDTFDVADSYHVPNFAKLDKATIESFAEEEYIRRAEMSATLDGLGIPHTELSSDDEIIGKLIVLLKRRRARVA